MEERKESERQDGRKTKQEKGVKGIKKSVSLEASEAENKLAGKLKGTKGVEELEVTTKI